MTRKKVNLAKRPIMKFPDKQLLRFNVARRGGQREQPRRHRSGLRG